MTIAYRYSTALAFLSGALLPVMAQSPSIPDVSTTAQEIVAHIHGTFSHFKGNTSNKMPDGPVAGNGDIGLVMSGTPEQLRFNIGKADFWGVQRGSITRVGWLELDAPDLKNATSEVNQNIGPANLTGKFTGNDHELSFASWVSATTNLVVVELKNSGSQPLSLSSKLFDGLGTTGNEATCGSGEESTWLKVSPDTMNVIVGNRLGMGPRGGFQGKIASLNIYDVTQDQVFPTATAKPLFHWPTSGSLGEHGPSADFSGGDRTGMTVGALLLPQKKFTVTAWVNATTVAELNFILSTMTSAYGKDKYPYQRGFALNLDMRCLSATLNYTTTTATDPFPLHQWVQVAAVYDGKALTLYQNGKQVATTTAFPSARDVMSWNKKTIHTGDKDLPFAGCAPEGVLRQRVIGPTAQEDQQGLKFTLAPGEEATLALSVLTDRNTPDFMKISQLAVQQAETKLRSPNSGRTTQNGGPIFGQSRTSKSPTRKSRTTGTPRFISSRVAARPIVPRQACGAISSPANAWNGRAITRSITITRLHSGGRCPPTTTNSPITTSR